MSTLATPDPPLHSHEPSRTWWASADPALNAHRDRANLWRIFINMTALPGELADRHRIGTIDLVTASQGFSALAEMDEALRARGFTRTTEWELGSGRGFVCWLDVDEQAVSA